MTTATRGGGPLHGARETYPDALGAVPLSTNTLVYKGNTAAKIVNPDPAKYRTLMVVVEVDNIRVRPGDAAVKTISAYSAANDTATCTAHGYITGEGPIQVANSGGALPTNLSAATNYWPIVVDVNTIKFATSRDNALDGVAIDLGSDGSGTQTITAMVGTLPATTGLVGVGIPLYKANNPHAISAPTEVTLCGVDANAQCVLWWLK